MVKFGFKSLQRQAGDRIRPPSQLRRENRIITNYGDSGLGIKDSHDQPTCHGEMLEVGFMSLKIIKEEPPPEDWTAIMPCPFCSNPGKLLSTPMYSNDQYGSNACVICTVCGAGGPVIEPENYMLVTHMNALAIKKWNKRGNLAGSETKLRRIAAVLNSNG
jgi:hypothetical protein